MLDLFMIAVLAFGVIIVIEKISKNDDRKPFQASEILGTVVVAAVVSIIKRLFGLPGLVVFASWFGSTVLIMKYVWRFSWGRSIGYSFVVLFSATVTSLLIFL